MSPVHLWISQNHGHVHGFKALIMSGDNDLNCSTLGTNYWIERAFKGLENKS